MYYLIFLILLALFSLAIRKFYKDIYLYQKRTNIPGPNWWDSLSVMKPGTSANSIAYIRDNKIYQGFFAGWLLTKYFVLAVDPEAAKFVLKEPRFQKTVLLSVSKKVEKHFGKNLVSIDGDDWRRHRTVINSGFTSQALSSYYPIFVDVTEKAIGTMPFDKDIELTDFFSRYTLDILGRTLFNYDFRRIDKENDRYYAAYRTLFTILPSFWGKMMFIFPSLSDIPFPIKIVREYLDGIDTLVNFFKDIIKEKKGKDDNSVLSRLLSAADKETLSEEELIANIWIFFVAGHETTANALVSALNCLRVYPDIQEKLYQEINSVVGDKIPEETDLEKMTYLDAFIQEVLRLHSPVPVLSTRVATEDVKYNDMIIPKGARVGIHFHTLHTNPEYWEDPLKFDPERFLGDKKKGRGHFLHIPFSAGLRQCIGNTFSLIEQRLFLSRLIHKYRVVDPKQLPPFPEEKVLSLGQSDCVPVRIEKRI